MNQRDGVGGAPFELVPDDDGGGGSNPVRRASHSVWAVLRNHCWVSWSDFDCGTREDDIQAAEAMAEEDEGGRLARQARSDPMVEMVVGGRAQSDEIKVVVCKESAIRWLSRAVGGCESGVVVVEGHRPGRGRVIAR